MFAKQKLSPSPSRGLALPCVLLAVFVACIPSPARADSLEDAARALARKVDARLKKELISSYAWENRSSISLSTSERMRAAFEAELGRLHLNLEFTSSAELSVVLAQGPSRIILIAEISNGHHELIGSEMILVSQFTAAERMATVLQLDRQLLWQQPEMMLDLAQSNDSFGKPDVMLVLGKESLSLYRWDQEKWLLKDSAPLPRSKLSQRDPRGEIHLHDHFFQFHLPGFECDGDAWRKLAFDCEERAGIWRAEFNPMLPFSLDSDRNFFAVDPHYIGPKKFSLAGFFAAARSQNSKEDFQSQTTLAATDGHTYVQLSGDEEEHIPESVERLPVEWGSDLASVSVKCREGLVVLASSARDHTSRDTLQGFEVEPRAATPVTAVADFPGPILSLGSASDSEAMVIVFNLTTGNYEAYRVTMPCGD